MAAMPSLPEETINNIVGFLRPDTTPSSYEITTCAQAGGSLARIAQSQNHVLHTLHVDSCGDIDSLYEFLKETRVEARRIPMSQQALYVYICCIDFRRKPSVVKRISSILFSCTSAITVDISHVRLSLSNAKALQHVTKLVLEDINFDGYSTILDLLTYFPALHHLSVAAATYGRLPSSSGRLPASLRTLILQCSYKRLGEDGRFEETFLKWMALCATTTLPPLETVGICAIEDDMVEDVVALMSHLGPSLRAVMLTVCVGHTKADYILSSYITSSNLPVVVYTDASYFESRKFSADNINIVI